MEVYVPLATHENEILFRLQHSQSQSVDALGYGKSQEYGLKKKQIFVDLFVTKADKRGQGKSFYYPTTHQKLGTPSYQSPKKGEENRKYFVGKEFHIFFSYSLPVFFFLIIARYLSVSETLERYLAIRNQTFLINFLERRRRQIGRGVVGRGCAQKGGG